MATVAGDQFLTVNPCGISRRTMERRRRLAAKMTVAKAPDSSCTPYWILELRHATLALGTTIPMLVGSRACRLLGRRLLSCVTRHSG
jgi:hypothetical protein